MTELTQEEKDFLSNIPQNAVVCIWGAANAGMSIKERLEEYRKDVKIAAYIDSSKQGEIDSVRIYRPDDLGKIRDKFDYMIVSTRSDSTVIDAVLFYYDINNYIRISKSLLKKYQFIPSKVSEILGFLDTEADRELYKDLIEARISGNTEKLQQYVLREHNITPDRKRTIKHYTSYINYDAIEVIIEGGMFNGLNTVIFKKLFKNLKKVYAFELLYEKVKNKSLAHIIDSMKELEIIPYAMWDKKDTLVFTQNVAAPYSSGINPTFNKNGSERNFEVDALSIDEFVENRKIDKVDFIKMDIEGAEMRALKGGEKTLLKFRPQMAISIYHSDNDMQDIPIYLHGLLKDYVFKIGQYSPDNDETILYAIPKELV